MLLPLRSLFILGGILVCAVMSAEHEFVHAQPVLQQQEFIENKLNLSALDFSTAVSENVLATSNPSKGYRAEISSRGMLLEDLCDDWYVEANILHERIGCAASVFRIEKQERKAIFSMENVDVEYVHSTAGLRQNFIVHRKSHEGLLSIPIIFNTQLNPVLFNETDLMFLNANGEQELSYEGLKVWDSKGTLLNAWMELSCESGEHILELQVDDREAVYPVTVDPLSTTPDHLLVGTQNSSQYGVSTASAGDLNGDGYSDLVIGASKGSMGQSLEGLAYVFYGSENGVGAVPDVTLQVDQAGAEFGCAVSTAGDVNGDGYADLLIGARKWESTAAQNSEGAVFIYYGSATGINTAYDEMFESNKQNAFMGSNVACAGDIDNDGFSDIIAGAYLAEFPTYQEGAAFIYRGSATGMVFKHRLEVGHAGGHFSRSVSSGGDINGDGYSDVVIGASLYDNLGTNDGKVFIYYGSPAGLGGGGTFTSPSASLDGSGINASQYGWSVTCAGDVNGDGFSDIAVGSYRDANGHFDEGRVYVYHGSAAGVVSVPAIILESNQADAWMGRWISGAGDVNGDGFGDLAVGIPLYDNGQTDEGVVNVYFGSSSGLKSTRDVLLQLNDPGSNFGESVASAGDLNGDGYSDIVAGAYLYGSTGAAAVFNGGGYNVETNPSTTMEGIATLEHLGTAVAGSGDINGDGLSDILLGALDASNGQVNEGIVYSYLSGSAGFVAAPTLLERNVSGGQFGKSLSTAGDVNGDGYADVIIGAPGISSGGVAYVYFGSVAGLPISPNRTLTGPIAGSGFGTSVSTAGDINSDGYADVIVGAPGANTAYVFTGSSAGTVTSPVTTLTGSGGNFGQSVSSAGDVNGDGYSDVIVGAPNSGNGTVHVYHGSQTGLGTTAAIDISNTNSGAEFGYSVSTAGDLNGDGFFDVVVGAPGYSNGQADEGAIYAYFGSPTGIVLAGFDRFERNQVNGRWGTVVDEAGDIDGDGYADIISGGPFMQSVASQADEGYAVIYNGTRFGLTTINTQVIQINVPNAHFGSSVAGIGDVDGDGFSDVLVGAPNDSPILSEQGTTHVFKGNRGVGLARMTRQYQANLVSPLATNCMDFSDPNNFGIGIISNHYMHRVDGRLHWEIAFEGVPFSGVPITNSVVGSDTSTAWTDLGTTGVEIKQLIFKEPGFIRYKWRVRVEYELSKAIDGQRYGRWFYGYGSGLSDIGVLPVEIVAFNGNVHPTYNELVWLVASETDVSAYFIERSLDNMAWSTVGSVEAIGTSNTTVEYVFEDREPPLGVAYYRLRIRDLSGVSEYSQSISLFRKNADVMLYPNPASTVVHVVGEIPIGAEVAIYDMAGRAIWNTESMSATDRLEVDIASLAEGIYRLQISKNGMPLAAATFIRN